MRLGWCAIALWLVACSSGSDPAAGSGGGATCSSSSDCAAGSFCDDLFDYCVRNPAVGQPGTCRPRSRACTASPRQSCGCDGHVYDSSCDAQHAGTDLDAAGGCAVPAGDIPCGWTFCDTATTYCSAIYNDTGPSDFTCEPLPASCVGSVDCACFHAGTDCASNCAVLSGNGVQGFRLACGLVPP